MAGWALGALLPRWRAMSERGAGRLLAVLYALWGTVLLAAGLRRCALRIIGTGGGQPAHAPWLILLLALPLLWMAWGKGAALFRAAELYYLIMLAALAALLGWGLLRADWGRALVWDGAVEESALALVGAAGSFLLVLPYINNVTNPAGRGSGLLWLAALGGVTVLIAFAAVGVLGGPVARRAAEPFLLLTGALGNTARLEGLSCALWLFADYARLSLLARCWGGGEAGGSRRALTGAAAGILLSLWPGVEGLSVAFLGWSTAAMALITAVFLLLFGKNSG